MEAYPARRTWPYVFVVVILFIAFLQLPGGSNHTPAWSDRVADRARTTWRRLLVSMDAWQANGTPSDRQTDGDRFNARLLLSSIVAPELENIPPSTWQAPWQERKRLWSWLSKSESRRTAQLVAQPLHPPVASEVTLGQADPKADDLPIADDLRDAPAGGHTAPNQADEDDRLVVNTNDPNRTAAGSTAAAATPQDAFAYQAEIENWPAYEVSVDGTVPAEIAPDLSLDYASDLSLPYFDPPAPPRTLPKVAAKPGNRASASASSGRTSGRSETTGHNIPSQRSSGTTSFEGTTRNPTYGPLSTAHPSGDRPDLNLSPAERANIADWLPEPEAPIAGDDDLVLNQAWPYPTALLALIAELRPESQQVASWKSQIKDQLSILQAEQKLNSDASKHALRELQKLASDANGLETYLTEPNRITLRRVRFAIERRVALWWHASNLAAAQETTPHVVEPIEAYSLLQTAEKQVEKHPYADAWRGYLQFDRLQQIATQTWVTDATVRQQVARQVLRNMSADDLTDEQRQFLNAPVFRELQTELIDWADGDVDLIKLANAIEQFEDVKSAALAEELVSMMESIRYSQRPGASPLYDALNLHYRNANIRISVTGQLMNDLLPVLKPIQQQIRDNILGAEVIGKNQTQADLQLQLIPDDGRLNMRLTAKGISRSQTVSRRGPFRFLSRDRSDFVAGKDLVMGTNGVFVSRAQATSNNRSQLLDIESDYDEVPLLGWVLRRLAKDGHDEQRPLLRAQVNRRVRKRASQQLDHSIHDRLTGAEKRVDEAILSPLRQLKIEPHTVEMRTTKERATVRFRLASARQLAAYTPRPRALRDSVMSLQVHESAANNVLQQLKLEDQRIKLEQLLQELATQLGIERGDIQDDLPENIEIRLGNERPIQFEFNDNRVLVSIHIQELKVPKRKTYRNFVVRGRYRADVDQTHVNLERDGGIELISERIGFRDQIALRGIFTKVMTRNHRLNILRGRIKNNAQLKQLAITQCVVRDGWIGVSIGKPRRPRVASTETP